MALTDPILKQGIDQLKTDIALTHDIVHGDENTVVQTEGGPVRSMAKLQKDNQAIIDSFIPSVEERELSANGDKANGFPRLSNFRLAILNAANQVKTYFVGNATEERTLQLPNRSGTIALLEDIQGNNSGINTGDETQASILEKLHLTQISGVNTGDQTLQQLGGQPLLTFEPVDKATLGKADGVATLDSTGKVPSGQLPSYVDDVLEFDSVVAFPAVGEKGKIYIPTDTNDQYRWTGSFYMKLVGSPGTTDAVPEGNTNKYFQESRVLNTLLTGYTIGANAVLAATDTIKSALGKLQKQISDILPILALKANSDSPAFTGVVTVPDLSVDNKSQQAVNSNFVQLLVSNLYNQVQGNSPEVLNTLAKLAASIGNDPNFLVSVNNLLAQKEMLANKTVDFGVVNDVLYPTVKAVKSYADSLLVKVVIDCGGWDASSTLWPSSTGTGPDGAVLKGNLWFVNRDGRLGGQAVSVGDSFRALVDNPGQDAANWAIMEHNVNYTPADKAGDTFGFIYVTGPGRSLQMTGNTSLSKSLAIGNGLTTMDIGLEGNSGGDLIAGTPTYSASWNTSSSALNFGVQNNLRMQITTDKVKINATGTSQTPGGNTALSLMHSTAGRDVSLELGDGMNPSVKLSYVGGNLHFIVGGVVRAKIAVADGSMIVDTVKTTTGETYWHTGNLKPGEANGIAKLGADKKLDDAQVPTTDKVAEGTRNLYFSEARVLSTKLIGFVVSTALSPLLVATDTVSMAFSKLQRQFYDVYDRLANLETNNTGVNTGDETRATILQKTGATALTGNNTGDETNDSILAKLGYTPIDNQWRGKPGGVATLDGNGQVPASQLPSFVDDVIEGSNIGTNGLTPFPIPGEKGKIYVNVDNDKTYRWSGSTYIEISASPGTTDAVVEGSTNLYFKASRVLDTALTNFMALGNQAISSTDTILTALGKIQTQLTYVINMALGLTQRTSGTNTGDETRSTIVTKIGFEPVSAATVNNYGPTKTGAGASGMWNISISGSAVSAGFAYQFGGVGPERTMQKRRNRIHADDGTSLNTSITSLETGFTYGGSGEVTGPFIHFGGLGGDADYGCQIVADYAGGNTLMFRARNDDTKAWNPWRKLWHDGNMTLSVQAAGNTVVMRDPNGYIFNSYINTTDDGTSGGNGNGQAVSGILGKQGDNYHRTLSAAMIKSYLGILNVTDAVVSGLRSDMEFLAANPTNVVFQGYVAERVVQIDAATATTTLDLSQGSVFRVIVRSNTTIVFDTSNIPASRLANASLSFTLMLINDATAGRGVAFSYSVRWTDHLPPQRTTAANARDDWYFYSDIGVNSWTGQLSNQNVF